MESISAESAFKEQIIKFSQLRIIARKNWLVISWFRFLVFVAAGFCGYTFYIQREFLYLLFLLLLCGLFIFLLKRSVILKEQIWVHDKRVWLNKNELDMLVGEPNKFSDGSDYKSNQGYLDDLDIFGSFSVFQLLNRTSTLVGQERLAAILQKPFLSKQIIKDYQAAIQLLSPLLEKRQTITCIASKAAGSNFDLEHMDKWMNEPLFFQGKNWLKILSWLLPIFNILALLYFLLGNSIYPAIAGIALAWAPATFYGKYIRSQQENIGGQFKFFRQYSELLKEFSSIPSGTSTVVGKLTRTSADGFKQIAALSTLDDFFEQRSNKMVNIILGSLFVYDIHLINALEKWKLENRSRFSEWLHAIAEIEALGSFSAFAFSHSDFIYPEVLDGSPVFQANDMVHPLIPRAERIANDVSLGTDNRLLIITGSNMSGKTTYLRMIGVNLLLAQCGMPVSARSFRYSPMQILSSIRVSDSLEEHTSFFMAELKRLQFIIRSLDQEIPALVLTDEILRGTNSADKTYGSAQFIKKLVSKNCVTLFATHDLSLGSLEEEYPGIIRNYCFESVITPTGLQFDYRLRPGLASNKNASYLMEKMGII